MNMVLTAVSGRALHHTLWHPQLRCLTSVKVQVVVLTTYHFFLSTMTISAAILPYK